MNGTVEFVAPSGVAKEAFDAGLNFLCGLLFADGGGESCGDFVGPLGKIFGNVEKDLCAVMRGGLGPALGFAGGFYGVPNVFAIAQRSFSEQFAIATVNGNTVARIGAGLFAANVELYGAIDIGYGVGYVGRGRTGRRRCLARSRR